MEIDRRSDEPPYMQVAGWLRERVRSGAVTSRLPSAVDLSQEWGIAVMTARKALRVLVDEGYAYRQAGMGTWVSPQREWPEG